MTTSAESHLESEFETVPVPLAHRRSLASVSALWFGFPMNLGTAVFGGMIVYSLGTRDGLIAIVLGNLVLLAYVGLLSFNAGSTGRSFSQQTAAVFGTRGRAVVTGFLATVVIGWFSFQIGLTGQTLDASLGWSALVGTLIGGLLYIALTFVGVKALEVLGFIGAPLFVVLGAVAISFGMSDGGRSLDSVMTYPGSGTLMTFGGAVSIVVAGFADSGTMTADFTRWAKDGRSAFLATMCAFPFANTLAYAIGGLVVAVGGSTDPERDGGGFLGLLLHHNPVLTMLGIIFVFINLGSVATHCLYNGAVGWSGIVRRSMRTMTLILGAIGLVIALTGVWSGVQTWLVLLGVFVPPIGAVMITSFWVEVRAARPLLNAPAFAAWAFGAAVALLVHLTLPSLVDALVGMIVAPPAYLLARRLLPAPSVAADESLTVGITS